MLNFLHVFSINNPRAVLPLNNIWRGVFIKVNIGQII